MEGSMLHEAVCEHRMIKHNELVHSWGVGI